MKRALVRVYIWTSVLAILAILGYFFYQVYEIREDTRAVTASRFDELSRRTADLWQNRDVQDAGRRLSRIVDDATGITPLFVSVYQFERGVDYLWAADDRFLQRVEGQTTVPSIRSNSLLHSRYSRSFQLADGEQRIMTAVYPAIVRDGLFPVLKRTLFASLVLVALVLLVAIVSLTARPRKRPAVVVTSHSESTDASGHERTPIHGPESRKDETTGLNPESVLIRRIDLELERAGYHEQDLSVALFEFSRGKKGDEQYHRNARSVLSFFTFEDLCFEYGHRGIVVVFPNTGLSETLKQIERFQQYYWGERQAWDVSDADFLCGVSSRNGRLVEGNRVIGECRTALSRAGSAPGRIVGFQPDPDLYREYLSNRR